VIGRDHLDAGAGRGARRRVSDGGALEGTGKGQHRLEALPLVAGQAAADHRLDGRAQLGRQLQGRVVDAAELEDEHHAHTVQKHASDNERENRGRQVPPARAAHEHRQQTDDEAERHKRMREFKLIVADLKTPVQRYMPGEHDASLDQGKAFQEHFGATHYSFDHKGVHFAVIDNVSDPQAAIGDAQIDWLLSDLKPLPSDAPIVVFTHRPLFDLAPQWDWATKDGSKAIDLLQHWKNVTVFYGHIHQEHHFKTGAIAHHAAQSLIFPLPAPLSQPKRAPVPWDPAHPRRGLGFREISVDESRVVFTLKEDSLEGTAAVQPAAAIGTY